MFRELALFSFLTKEKVKQPNIKITLNSNFRKFLTQNIHLHLTAIQVCLNSSESYPQRHFKRKKKPQGKVNLS